MQDSTSCRSSAAETSGRVVIPRVNVRGGQRRDVWLIDTSPADVRCTAAVKIGDHAYGGGVAPIGDTCRVLINNVISRSQHTILIGGSLSDSIISNILRYDSGGEAVTVKAGPQYVRNVTITNVHVAGNERPTDRQSRRARQAAGDRPAMEARR